MAERRMFAKSVINSARFLTMPPSSRLLYYDLGMAADDDGVVEAFTVMRTTGAADDDLRVLVSKGFVSLLNDELVAYITDWSTNNQIRKDRYQPSFYKNLLVKLADGNQRSTQYSIGKYSTDEENKAATPPRPHFVPPSIDEIRAYCTERKNTVDAERFFDFYSANGWKQGRGKPIVDWRAAVRTWERQTNAGQADPSPRQYDAATGTWR